MRDESNLPLGYPFFPIPQSFDGKNQHEKLLSFLLTQAHIKYKCNQMIELDNGTEVEVDHVIENKLIVEVNGGIHNTKVRKMLDKFKIKELHNLGYKVLSFTDSEIQENQNRIISLIKKAISKL